MHSITVDGRDLQPSKIVCIGRNYVAHIEELGNELPDDMVVFLKPNSALSPQLHSSMQGEPLHYEAELAFCVQGGQLAAVAFGLDMTRRELQGRLKASGLPWERAKAFDGAAVLSHFVSLEGAEEQPLRLELDVDGNARQRGDTSHMLYPPDVILAQLQRFMTLEDGDVIMTGTPAGVGIVQPGERFTGSIYCGQALLLTASWQAH